MRGHKAGCLGGDFAKRGQHCKGSLARSSARQKIAGMKIVGQKSGIGQAVNRRQRAVGAGENGNDGVGDGGLQPVPSGCRAINGC